MYNYGMKSKNVIILAFCATCYLSFGYAINTAIPSRLPQTRTQTQPKVKEVFKQLEKTIEKESIDIIEAPEAPTGDAVYSSNIIIAWPSINHAVIISKEDVSKLKEIHKVDPVKFKEITRPVYKISRKEFSELVNQQHMMIASK